MKKTIFNRFMKFGILLFSLAILFGSVLLYINSPVKANADADHFFIEHGVSLHSIMTDLEKKSLIRSGLFAYLYARTFNMSMKAGTYQISPESSTIEILRKISEGKQEYIRVTVPEGLTLSKTAEHFEKAGIVSAQAFLEAARNTSAMEEHGLPGKNTEGFLFPDTYFFPYGTDAKTVVDRMVNTFFRKIATLPDVPSDPKKLYEKVILASIVEREYRVEKEAPLIASVFMNRLKIGMGLQSCATIEYIITEIHNKPHPTRLLDKDLEIRSAYNTYLWAGLPPGPISSPGLVALTAAFSPPKSPFLYFRLTDPVAGTHSFTRTLEEHVQAGLRLELKQAAGN